MEVKDFESTIEWYNQNAKEYSDSTKRLGSPNYIYRFSKLLKKGAKVLDMGCAGGRDTITLHNLGFIVTGIDISKGLIGEAKKSYPECNFIVGNFLDLPFEENSFDGVWAQMSFLHLETLQNVEKAFSEMARILVSGGVVHFAVKAKMNEKETDVVADIYGDHKRFFRYYTLEQLGELFEKHGFDIIDINQIPETELKDSLHRRNIDLIIALAKKK